MSEIREAPLANHIDDDLEFNYYMITVNVSPKKFIANKHWVTYSNVEQEIILLKEMNKNLLNKIYFDLTYRTELTKQGHKHLHIVLQCTKATVDELQTAFHKKFGMPNLDPQIACNVSMNLVHDSFAKAYVTKEDIQDECMFRKHIKPNK